MLYSVPGYSSANAHSILYCSVREDRNSLGILSKVLIKVITVLEFSLFLYFWLVLNFSYFMKHKYTFFVEGG